MDFKTNIKEFFKTDNRSMMGGWTIEGRKKAEAEAAKLKGKEREEAEKAIKERIEKEAKESDNSNEK
ncbi:hypothetical protein [Tenacibaculum aiptasiae]|uniref:hypothetical protein n=1 Tax=Tenacibaculum aiptasiae TaxID=426481 RepID=UPI003B5CF375